MTPYIVAVRTLCEFAAKHGDLDVRFTPSPTSQQGLAGHRTVATRRSASYRREVSVSLDYKHLHVRGRADGFDPEQRLLEEVKTFKGDLTLMSANHRHLHWAQAKVYGAMLCAQLGLPTLTVSLVYFDVDMQVQAPSLAEHCTAAVLQSFFEDVCERFLAWAALEMAHRLARDAALTRMAFPYEAFRSGQRELAKAVFNAARLGRVLLAQAPTGIGKTIATLFPMLKACPAQQLDKVFFLTAKGSGRALALGALEALEALGRNEPASALRVIELVARDKACEHPDKMCHGESCPLARGFYDRLPAARTAAMAAMSVRTLTRDALRDVALEHEVCPYYLGQEVVRWCDVVVGDYNHFFDGSALLHGLTQANSWRVGLLVDEAHNLVDRARAMYSASLHSAQLRALRAVAPAGLKKSLDRLHRCWSRLLREADEAYVVLDQPPPKLVSALQDTTASITEHLASCPTQIDRGLLQFYFDALQFTRLLETFGTHSLFDISRDRDAGRRSSTTLCLRNVVPAQFLKPRFAAARSTVLFSATLTPWNFYADTLGLPENVAWLDVPTPFAAEQLTVRIVRDVSTRYGHRDRSLEPIARIIATQLKAVPGNYIAFFSSFDYLEKAADVFSAQHPGVATWRQGRRMNEAEREAFLARFAVDGRGVGFAVLGGSFAEGIDLVGTRLMGAFIATLGLPQFNAVNEELRRRLAVAFGAGYEYTYLFPGIRKVVQAAGRVIRTVSDRGSVHLIDDRFGRPAVRRLLPNWWHAEDAAAPEDAIDPMAHGERRGLT